MWTPRRDTRHGAAPGTRPGGVARRAALAGAFLALFAGACNRPVTPGGDVTQRPLLIGVLGDSDSHSYHDRILLAEELRGGPEFHDVTFQWTESLQRLRGDQVDLGPWGEWGGRRRYTLLRRLVGLPGRSPRKEDFENNLAISGARCEDLTTGVTQQVMPLTDIMRRDPASWQRGLVVIRIGVNSLESSEQIAEYARSGLTSSARAAVDACVAHIREAVRRLREVQPRVGVALVGLADDLNWVPLVQRWHSAPEVERVRAVLDYFDAEMQRLAQESPPAVFVDDRAWWTLYWGDRAPDGVPDYRAVSLGGRESITNTQGDHPRNGVVADGHAGTICNALWARHMIERVDEVLGLGISPPLDAEIADLVDPSGDLGLAPADERGGGPLLSLPRDIALSAEDLPWTVAIDEARDSSGEDISRTAIAWMENVANRDVKWLYGSGRALQIRADRFPEGDYRLHMAIRDRHGLVAEASAAVTISAEVATSPRR